MKKILKMISFISTVILLSFAMAAPAWAFSIFDVGDDGDSLSVRVELIEELGSIYAIMTSAIDDSPFVGFFDPETGIASFFKMDGESGGHRYVGSEEAFWELVNFNAELTSRSVESRMAIAAIDRTNRNVSVIDVEARMLIEYDEHGNRTETYLSYEFAKYFPGSRVFGGLEGHTGQFLQHNYNTYINNAEPMIHMSGYETEMYIDEESALTFPSSETLTEFEEWSGLAEPFFDVRWRMQVPFADHPNPTRSTQGRSSLVGDRHHPTIHNQHNRVELWSFEFPPDL